MADTFKIIDGPSTWSVVQMLFMHEEELFTLEKKVARERRRPQEISVIAAGFAPELNAEINAALEERDIRIGSPGDACFIMGFCKWGTRHYSHMLHMAFSMTSRQGVVHMKEIQVVKPELVHFTHPGDLIGAGLKLPALEVFERLVFGD